MKTTFTYTALAVILVFTTAHTAPKENGKPAPSTLLKAVASGNTSQVSTLLEAGEDPNGKNDAGKTALLLAAESGHLEIMKLLIAKGASVSAADSSGRTPLFAVCLSGNKPAVELLLAAGADIHGATGTLKTEGRQSGANTALHAASRSGHEIVELLLARGAKVNARNTWGWTPLFEAVMDNNPRTVNSLLRHGADPNLFDAGGVPLCFYAVYKKARDPQTVMPLKYGGCDFGRLNNTGYAALHLCAAMGYEKEAAALISAGASVSVQDSMGRTPLHIAAEYGQREMCALFLDRGASVNAVDSFGQTPLHRAWAVRMKITIDYLMLRGADPNIKDRYGKTPARTAGSGGSGALIAVNPASGPSALPEPDMKKNCSKKAVPKKKRPIKKR